MQFKQKSLHHAPESRQTCHNCCQLKYVEHCPAVSLSQQRNKSSRNVFVAC